MVTPFSATPQTTRQKLPPPFFLLHIKGIFQLSKQRYNYRDKNVNHYNNVTITVEALHKNPVIRANSVSIFSGSLQC